MNNTSLYVLKPTVTDATIIQALKFVPTEFGFSELKQFCGDSFLRIYTEQFDSVWKVDIKINNSHYVGFAGYDIGTLESGCYVMKYLKNGEFGTEIYIATEAHLNRLFDEIPNE